MRTYHKLCGVLGLALHLTTATAATYFVSPAGNDGNPGTKTAPWKTIGKANATLKSGDTVVIQAGTYAQNINPVNDGRAGAPITYMGDGSNDTVITGISGAQGWIGAAANLARNYIVVDGLTLQQTAPAAGFSYIVMVSGNNNIVRNSTIDGVRTDLDVELKIDSITEDGVHTTGGNNLLTNNIIQNLSHCGIGLGGRFNVVRDNTIRNTLYDAVRISSNASNAGIIQGHLIEGNTFSNSWASDGVQTNGYIPSGVDKQQPTTCGLVIRDNVIFNNGENGIDLKGACHIVVDGNTIFGTRGDSDGCYKLLGVGICDRSAPGGIMHGSHALASDIIVRNNILYDNNGGILTSGDAL